MYRKLHSKEIEQLQQQGCRCNDWNLVEVKNAFTPDFVWNTRFTGAVRLGVFEEKFTYPSGAWKHCGIYSATIHNCNIGDNVLIADVSRYIANYDIGDFCRIEQVGEMSVSGISSFGNGTVVYTLNEKGNDPLESENCSHVTIHTLLSAQQACIQAFPYLVDSGDSYWALKKLTDKFISLCASDRGTVGEHSIVQQVQTVINVKIGKKTEIAGASLLQNGTICDQARVGCNVIVRNFIIANRATVTDSVRLDCVFVGQCSRLANGFSANHCLFFSNCHFENGEAVSLFAGPHSVSHHKSTLLIGLMLSFANAGSGSNQSNHQYKTGPIHFGICGRGLRLASNSFVSLPAHIGEFTLVMGQHLSHPDTSGFPFSYLVEKEGKSYLLPAINFFKYGTFRDAEKWQERDKRQSISPDRQLDSITYNLLTPHLAEKIIKALKELKVMHQRDSGECTCTGFHITQAAVERGIEYYRLILNYFVLKSTENSTTKMDCSNSEWIDLCGLSITKEGTANVILNSNTLEEINAGFKSLEKSFPLHQSSWVSQEFLYNKFIPDSNLEECEKRIEECLYDDWFKDIELNAVEKGYLDNFNDWNDWNIQTLPSYDRPPTIKWD